MVITPALHSSFPLLQVSPANVILIHSDVEAKPFFLFSTGALPRTRIKQVGCDCMGF